MRNSANMRSGLPEQPLLLRPLQSFPAEQHSRWRNGTRACPIKSCQRRSNSELKPDGGGILNLSVYLRIISQLADEVNPGSVPLSPLCNVFALDFFDRAPSLSAQAKALVVRSVRDTPRMPQRPNSHRRNLLRQSGWLARRLPDDQRRVDCQSAVIRAHCQAVCEQPVHIIDPKASPVARHLHVQAVDRPSVVHLKTPKIMSHAPEGIPTP